MFDPQVIPYTGDNLNQVLSEAAHRGQVQPTQAEIARVGKLDPVIYLDGYLERFCRDDNFKARTIVIEQDYIDRDYLTDYAGYYSTAFQHVEKKTTRIHFFCGTTFALDKFKCALVEDGGTRKELQDNYLGFVVVRPMQDNFMGRTCLKHYPREKTNQELIGEEPAETKRAVTDTRHYTVLRDYRVNLYGLPLHVNTIAFQEQDSVVGACASAAIYALLHGVKPIFDTSTYSALEITRIANRFSAPTALNVPSMRALPNTGLSFGQMYQTLGELDLSPTLVSIAGDPQHQADAIATLYAYLSGGLPVLTHVGLVPKQTLTNAGNEWETVKGVIFDAEKHAFTVTGYSMAAEPKRELTVDDDAQTRLDEVARRVNKFYVHCDRIGPFAKFWLERHSEWLTLRPEALKEKKVDENGISHVEQLAYRKIGSETLAVPVVFIVPTNEKLRLSFKDAYEIAHKVQNHLDKNTHVIWDIKVADVHTLRASWRSSSNLSNSRKLKALTQAIPRFCWRVIATLDAKTPAFEIVLDCTAVDAGTSILLAVSYSTDGDYLLEHVRSQLQANYEDALAKREHLVRPLIMQRLMAVINACEDKAA